MRRAAERCSSRTGRRIVPFKDGQIVNAILKDALAATGQKPVTPYVGSHLLRHSLATRLVNAGASLDEVGDVLRHRSRASTMVYVRLDIDGLRSIAQPWPVAGGRAMSLTPQLDRYLSVRRSLGYDLRTDERMLRRFARFADHEVLRTSTRRCSCAGRRACRCGHIDAIGPARQGAPVRAVAEQHRSGPRSATARAAARPVLAEHARISTARPRSHRSSQRPRRCRRSTACAG